jgi:uncharacterized protein YbjT (DUF2867 family)
LFKGTFAGELKQDIMKLVVTGSLGNISKPLTKILVENGHDVTVISKDAEKEGQIESVGAKAAIGSVSDTAFLTRTFEGADAIYTMVPPNWTVSNYRQYIGETGLHYRNAIEASGVGRVVNLSSIGAHLSNGTGPIAGLYDVEQTLNTLNGVAIQHLRAGIFFINFFFDIPLIQSMGIMGANYSNQASLVMVHPRDIAAFAARELQHPFEGKNHRYVVSEELQVGEIVKVIGASIGKPDLPWVQFSDEDAFTGMKAAGMSEAIAHVYVEMGKAIESGALFEDFEAHKPLELGPTKLTDFVNEFAAVYNANMQFMGKPQPDDHITTDFAPLLPSKTER